MSLQEYPSKSFLVVLGAIALVLAVALVFAIRLVNEIQSEPIAEEQQELLGSAERAEDELIVESDPVEPDPQKLLSAQK